MSHVWRLCIFCLCIPAIAWGASTNTAGFVQGLWYSEDILLAGEPVRIYAAIRNNTGADLSGTVRFFIDDDVITTRRVTALDGRIIETWTDWTPTYGSHDITAELSRVELSTVGGTEETITVTAGLATDTVFIDYDTDGDGKPNESDTDDDGDGILDITEINDGSDPLDPHSPPPEPAPTAIQNTTDRSGIHSGEHNETTGTSTLEGLEQFLTPSRADTMLSNITDWSKRTKRAIDNYRDSRAAVLTVPSSTAPIAVNSDGFGEITRSEAGSEPREYEGADSIVAEIVMVFATFFGAIFSAILATLSFALSYPILIQVSLLILLLIIILRIARFFGRRPKGD